MTDRQICLIGEKITKRSRMVNDQASWHEEACTNGTAAGPTRSTPASTRRRTNDAKRRSKVSARRRKLRTPSPRRRRPDRFMRPMEIHGLGGRTLAEAWVDGPVAYLSVSMPEFPNLFMLNGPNGPVGNFSLIQVAEIQMAYILKLISRLQSGASREIYATEQAMREHEKQRIEAAQSTVWVTGCNSWYLDDRGVPAAWPWKFSRFREVMAEPDLGAYQS